VLLAQGVARTRMLPVWLTDGWQAYTAALLPGVGVLDRRAGGRGAANPSRAGGRHKTCTRRRSSRSVTRRVLWWRSAPGGLGWPPPLGQAVVSAPVGCNDPDGVHGTVGGDAAGAGGALASPYPLFVLEPHTPPGQGLAQGQPLQLYDAA
jgi:hypothetical protein